jgi:uncharacterized protein (DUF433 family)
MTRDQLDQRVWIDPARFGGWPCIRGHRIRVSLVLDLPASDSTGDEIVREHGITPEMCKRALRTVSGGAPR